MMMHSDVTELAEKTNGNRWSFSSRFVFSQKAEFFLNSIKEQLSGVMRSVRRINAKLQSVAHAHLSSRFSFYRCPQTFNSNVPSKTDMHTHIPFAPLMGFR